VQRAYLLRHPLTAPLSYRTLARPEVVKRSIGGANVAIGFPFQIVDSGFNTIGKAEYSWSGVVDASWIEADDIKMLRRYDQQ